MSNMMDKTIVLGSCTANTAADTNWAQTSTALLDNSTGTVTKVVDAMYLQASIYPGTNNKYFYLVVLVTDTDGVIPSLTGTTSNVNTVLNNIRGRVWTTISGYIKGGSYPDEKEVIVEPSTKRTLKPGQKLVMILTTMNQGTASADTLNCLYDYNLFYHY